MKKYTQRRDYSGIYGTSLDVISALPEADQPLMWQAVGEYTLAYVEPSFPKEREYLLAVFIGIKHGIDKMHSKADNGAKGGRPRIQKAPGVDEVNGEEVDPNKEDLEGASNNQTETKPKPNHNQTITKPKPNRNQTITKPKPNRNQTETKPKPNHNQTESETVQEIEQDSLLVNYNKNILLMSGAWDKFLVLFGEKVRADALQGDWFTAYQNLARYLYEQMTVDSVLTYNGIEFGPIDWWDISRNMDYSAVLPVLTAMVRNDEQAKEPKYYALGVLAERVKAGWVYAPKSVLKQITALGDKVLMKKRADNEIKAAKEREMHEFSLKRYKIIPIKDVLAPPSKEQEKEAKSIWQNLLKQIQPTVGKLTYELWLENLVPIKIDDNVLVLEAGSDMMQKQATQHLEKVLPEQRVRIVC